MAPAALLSGSERELRVALEDARAGLKLEMELYLPPSVTERAEVRGIIAASDYQAGRDIYTHTGYRALADRLTMAVIRHRFNRIEDGRIVIMPDDTAANLLRKGLVEASQRNGLIQLEDAPLVLTGLSASGAQAVNLANHMEGQVIAIVGYHTRGMMLQSKASRQVPALFPIGGRDSFYSPLASHARLVYARRQGAMLWTAVYQSMMPHQKLGTDEFVLAWLEEVITQRLPGSTVSTDAPPALREIDPRSGWLCTLKYDSLTEIRAYGSAIASIVPAEDFQGDPAEAYWMPSEKLARMWQAVSTAGDERPKLGSGAVGSLESPVPVSRVQSKVIVDADAADWHGVIALPAPYSGLERGSLKLAWNEEGLFGIVEFGKHVSVADSERPPQSDRLELFLDSALSRVRSRDLVEDALERGRSQSSFRAEWARQYTFGAGDSEEENACSVHEIKLYRTTGPTDRIPFTCRMTDNGYVVEFQIPADELSEGSLRVGSRMGMNYAIRKKGATSEFFFEQTNRGAHAIPALWGTIQLSE